MCSQSYHKPLLHSNDFEVMSGMFVSKIIWKSADLRRPRYHKLARMSQCFPKPSN